MRNTFVTSVGVLLLLLSVRTNRAVAQETPAPTTTTSEAAIAVADFSGKDADFGRFLADTLLTDLAQSERLRLVERTEIRKALLELKLQSTGLVEPQQVQQLGKLISADKVIVGSYQSHNGTLTVNARLLEVGTGRLAPGGAANVSGNENVLLPLVHQLAHLLHKKITGTDFRIDGELEPVDPAPASNISIRDADDTTAPVPGGGIATTTSSAPPSMPMDPARFHIQDSVGDDDAGTSLAASVLPAASIYRIQTSFISMNTDATVMPTASVIPTAPILPSAPVQSGFVYSPPTYTTGGYGQSVLSGMNYSQTVQPRALYRSVAKSTAYVPSYRLPTQHYYTSQTYRPPVQQYSAPQIQYHPYVPTYHAASIWRQPKWSYPRYVMPSRPQYRSYRGR